MHFAPKPVNIVALIGIASIAAGVTAAYQSDTYLDTRELDDLFGSREVGADELFDLMERSPGIASLVKTGAKAVIKGAKSAGGVAKKAIRPAMNNIKKAKGAVDQAQELLANAKDPEGNNLDAANNKNFQIDIGIRDLDDIEEYERSFDDNVEERNPMEELEEFLESRELKDMMEGLYERLGRIGDLD